MQRLKRRQEARKDRHQSGAYLASKTGRREMPTDEDSSDGRREGTAQFLDSSSDMT